HRYFFLVLRQLKLFLNAPCFSRTINFKNVWFMKLDLIFKAFALTILCVGYTVSLRGAENVSQMHGQKLKTVFGKLIGVTDTFSFHGFSGVQFQFENRNA